MPLRLAGAKGSKWLTAAVNEAEGLEVDGPEAPVPESSSPLPSPIATEVSERLKNQILKQLIFHFLLVKVTGSCQVSCI